MLYCMPCCLAMTVNGIIIIMSLPTSSRALVSLEGVVPSRMVGVSASVNLPLHHKVQKFCSSIGSPGWSRKKGRKTVVV